MPPERRQRFVELLASLPKIGESEDAEVELRAVLCPIVRRVVEGVPENPQVDSNPELCPNCDAPTMSPKSPYCSAHCREMAAFIRQFRTSFADGVIFQPDRQVGMGQALWSVQGGGFPRRQQMVKPREIQRVLEKAEGLCWKCGQPATGVDHFGSACNRTSNLRAVCDACNRGNGFGVADFDPGPEVKRLYDEIALRIGSIAPIRACDDAATWDWRGFLKLRKVSP